MKCPVVYYNGRLYFFSKILSNKNLYFRLKEGVDVDSLDVSNVFKALYKKVNSKEIQVYKFIGNLYRIYNLKNNNNEEVTLTKVINKLNDIYFKKYNSSDANTISKFEDDLLSDFLKLMTSKDIELFEKEEEQKEEPITAPNIRIGKEPLSSTPSSILETINLFSSEAIRIDKLFVPDKVANWQLVKKRVSKDEDIVTLDSLSNFVNKILSYSIFNPSDDILARIIKNLNIQGKTGQNIDTIISDFKIIFGGIREAFKLSHISRIYKDDKAFKSNIFSKYRESLLLMLKYDVSLFTLLETYYKVLKLENAIGRSKKYINNYETMLAVKSAHDFYTFMINIIDKLISEHIANNEELVNVSELFTDEFITKIKENIDKEARKLYGLDYDLSTTEEFYRYINTIISARKKLMLEIAKKLKKGKQHIKLNEVLSNQNYLLEKVLSDELLIRSTSIMMSKMFLSFFTKTFLGNVNISDNTLYSNESTEQDVYDSGDEDKDEYTVSDDESMNNDDELAYDMTVEIPPMIDLIIHGLYNIYELDGKIVDKSDIFSSLATEIKNKSVNNIPILFLERKDRYYELSKSSLTKPLGDKDTSFRKEEFINNLFEITALLFFSPSEIEKIKDYNSLLETLYDKVASLVVNLQVVNGFLNRVKSSAPILNLTVDAGNMFAIVGINAFNKPHKNSLIFTKMDDSQLKDRIFRNWIIEIGGTRASYKEYINSLSNTRSDVSYPTVSVLNSTIVMAMNFNIKNNNNRPDSKVKLIHSYNNNYRTKHINLSDYVFTVLYYIMYRNEDGTIVVNPINERTSCFFTFKMFGKELYLNFSDIGEKIRDLEKLYLNMLFDFYGELVSFLDTIKDKKIDKELIDSVAGNKFFQFAYHIFEDTVRSNSTSLGSLYEQINKTTYTSIIDVIEFSKLLAADLNKFFEKIDIAKRYDDYSTKKAEFKDYSDYKRYFENLLNNEYWRQKLFFEIGMFSRSFYSSQGAQSDNIPISFKRDTEMDKDFGSIIIAVLDNYIYTLLINNLYSIGVIKYINSKAVVGINGYNFPTKQLMNGIYQLSKPEHISVKKNFAGYMYRFANKLGYRYATVNYVREIRDKKIFTGGSSTYKLSNIASFLSSGNVFGFNPTVKKTFALFTFTNNENQFTSILDGAGYNKALSLMKASVMSAIDTFVYMISKEFGTDITEDEVFKNIINRVKDNLFTIANDYIYKLIVSKELHKNVGIAGVKAGTTISPEDYKVLQEIANEYIAFIMNPFIYILDYERRSDFIKDKIFEDIENDKGLQNKLKKIREAMFKTFGRQGLSYFNNNFLDRYMMLYNLMVAIHEEINARRQFKEYRNANMIPEIMLKKNKNKVDEIDDSTLFVLDRALSENMKKQLKRTVVVVDGVEMSLFDHITKFIKENSDKEGTDEFELVYKLFIDYIMDNKIKDSLLTVIVNTFKEELESADHNDINSIFEFIKMKIEKLTEKVSKNTITEEDFITEYRELYKELIALLKTYSFNTHSPLSLYKSGIFEKKDSTIAYTGKIIISTLSVYPFIYDNNPHYVFNYGVDDANAIIGINRYMTLKENKKALDELNKMMILLDTYKDMTKAFNHFVNETLQKTSLYFTIGVGSELWIFKDDVGDTSKRLPSQTSSGVPFIVNHKFVDSSLYVTYKFGEMISKTGRFKVMLVDDLVLDLTDSQLYEKLNKIVDKNYIYGPFKKMNHTDAHCFVLPHLWYYAAYQYEYANRATYEVMKFINEFDAALLSDQPNKEEQLITIINEFIEYKNRLYLSNIDINFIPIIKMQFYGKDYYDSANNIFAANNHKYTWTPIHPLFFVGTKIDISQLGKDGKTFRDLLDEDERFMLDLYTKMIRNGIMYITSGIKISKPVKITYGQEGIKTQGINVIYNVKTKDSDNYTEYYLEVDDDAFDNAIVVEIDAEFLKLNTKNATEIKQQKPLNTKYPILYTEELSIANVIRDTYDTYLRNSSQLLLYKNRKDKLKSSILLKEITYNPNIKRSNLGSKVNRYTFGTSHILFPQARFYVPKVKLDSEELKDKTIGIYEYIYNEYEFSIMLENLFESLNLRPSGVDNVFNLNIEDGVIKLDLLMDLTKIAFIKSSKISVIKGKKYFRINTSYSSFIFEIVGFRNEQTGEESEGLRNYEQVKTISNIKDADKIKNDFAGIQDIDFISLYVRPVFFIKYVADKSTLILRDKDKPDEEDITVSDENMFIFKPSLVIKADDYKENKDIVDLNLFEEVTNRLIVEKLKRSKDAISVEKVDVSLSPVNVHWLFLKHLDGKPILTIDRLNECLKEDYWVNKNLEYIVNIAYRIPLQTYGSYVVYIPKKIIGITAAMGGSALNNMRTGGDFDNDSLTTNSGSYNIKVTYKESEQGREITKIYYFSYIKDRNNLLYLIDKLKMLIDKGLLVDVEVVEDTKDMVKDTDDSYIINANRIVKTMVLTYIKGYNFNNYFLGVVPLYLSELVKKLYDLNVGSATFLNPSSQTTYNSDVSLVTKTIGFIVYVQQLLNGLTASKKDLENITNEFIFGDISTDNLFYGGELMLLNSKTTNNILQELITFAVDSVKDQSGSMIINMMKGSLLHTFVILSELLSRHYKEMLERKNQQSEIKEFISEYDIYRLSSLNSLLLLYTLNSVMSDYKNKIAISSKDEEIEMDYKLEEISDYYVALYKSLPSEFSSKVRHDDSLLSMLNEITSMLYSIYFNPANGLSTSGEIKTFDINSTEINTTFEEQVGYLTFVKELMKAIGGRKFKVVGNETKITIGYPDKNGTFVEREITVDTRVFANLLWNIGGAFSKLQTLKKEDYSKLFNYEAVKVNKINRFTDKLTERMNITTYFQLLLLYNYLKGLEEKKILNVNETVKLNSRTVVRSLMVSKYSQKAVDIVKATGGSGSYMFKSPRYNHLIRFNIAYGSKTKYNDEYNILLDKVLDRYFIENVNDKEELKREYRLINNIYFKDVSEGQIDKIIVKGIHNSAFIIDDKKERYTFSRGMNDVIETYRKIRGVVKFGNAAISTDNLKKAAKYKNVIDLIFLLSNVDTEIDNDTTQKSQGKSGDTPEKALANGLQIISNMFTVFGTKGNNDIFYNVLSSTSVKDSYIYKDKTAFRLMYALYSIFNSDIKVSDLRFTEEATNVEKFKEIYDTYKDSTVKDLLLSAFVDIYNNIQEELQGELSEFKNIGEKEVRNIITNHIIRLVENGFILDKEGNRNFNVYKTQYLKSLNTRDKENNLKDREVLEHRFVNKLISSFGKLNIFENLDRKQNKNNLLLYIYKVGEDKTEGMLSFYANLLEDHRYYDYDYQIGITKVIFDAFIDALKKYLETNDKNILSRLQSDYGIFSGLFNIYFDYYKNKSIKNVSEFVYNVFNNYLKINDNIEQLEKLLLSIKDQKQGEEYNSIILKIEELRRLKDKVYNTIVSFGLFAAIASRMKKESLNVLKLSYVKNPYNILLPNPYIIYLSEILNEINTDVVGFTQKLKDGSIFVDNKIEDGIISKHNVSRFDKFNKVVEENIKLAIINANINVDIRNNKVNIKMRKDKDGLHYDLNLDDFSDAKNKLDVGNIEKYYNFYKTLKFTALSKNDVSNGQNAQYIENLSLVRKMIHTYFENLFKIVSNNISMMTMFKYDFMTEKVLENGIMVDKVRPKYSGLKIDREVVGFKIKEENGNITYDIGENVQENIKISLENYVNAYIRNGIFGILTSYRLIFNNEFVKSIVLTDFKYSSETNYLEDVGVFASGKFYDKISKYFIELMVNGGDVHEDFVTVLYNILGQKTQVNKPSTENIDDLFNNSPTEKIQEEIKNENKNQCK